MCLENYIDRLCVSYYYEFVRLCKSVRCLRIKEIHAIFCPLFSVVLLCVVPYTPACKIDRYDMRCVHTYVSGKYAKMSIITSLTNHVACMSSQLRGKLLC